MDVRYRNKISWPLMVTAGFISLALMFAALFGVAYLIVKVCEYL